MPHHLSSTTMGRCCKIETCTESPTASNSVKVVGSSQKKRKTEVTLPNEIVYEILIKLPVEVLRNCMSVCKSWNSMIKSSHFILSHLELKLLTKSSNARDMNVKDDVLLVHTETRVYNGPPYFDEVFTLDCNNDNNEYTESPRVIIMSGIRTAVSSIYGAREFSLEKLVSHGSCNGLICAVSYDTVPMIWNPSIRKIFFLPSPSLFSNCDNRFILGYDSHNKDFKVLHMSNKFTGSYTMFEVFSLRGGSWKDLNTPQNVEFWYDYASEIHGAFHWLCIEPRPNSSKKNTTLVTFNLSTESFKQMVIPKKVRKRKPWASSVVNYRDSFALLSRRKNRRWIVDLWVMNEYDVGESWTKVMKIWFEDVPAGYPVYFRKNGEIMQATGGGVVIYDRHRKRKIVKSLFDNGYGVPLLDPFFASLVLLDRADAFSY